MPRDYEDDPPTLASYWAPPTAHTDDGEQRGPGRPLAVIATTYTFHAGLFEDDLLPRFLGLRFDPTERERAFVLEREQALALGVRAFVLVDAGHTDPGQSTLRWVQLPVRVTDAAQHAKVSVLVWEHCVRVIVASANLTRSGYRYNREMAAALDFRDEDSSVPRKVLTDVLSFLEEYRPWIRASKEAGERFMETLEDVRARTDAWDLMPTDLGSRRPQVTFAPCVPERAARGARIKARTSALASFVEHWGNRSASEVTVMTPFVGASAEGMKPVLDGLLGRDGLRRSRKSEGFLVVPGAPSESDPDRRVVDLPRWFLRAWADRWRIDETTVPTLVVSRASDGKEPARALHAKALLASDDRTSLLMMGSSNFSVHGLGVGTANFEANLIYLDDKEGSVGGSLEDTLPVNWDRDRADGAKWPDVVQPIGGEDEASAQLVPAVFAWATLRPRSRTLTIGFDPAETLPARWSLRLPKEPNLAPLLDDAAMPRVPTPPQITVGLDERARKRDFASLTVSWFDAEGKTNAAPLAVTVDDPNELAVPEGLRGLGADGILDCLLSGQDPVEWVESASERARGERVPASLDPLRSVDTSAYSLYRVRRFGRALGRIAERVLATPRMKDALQYRLEQDPIGPRALGEAVVREWKDQGAAHVRFALAELRLCMAHVTARIHGERATKEADLRPLFRQFLASLESLQAGVADSPSVAEAAAPRLDQYVKAIDDKCARLLGARRGDPSHAR